MEEMAVLVYFIVALITFAIVAAHNGRKRIDDPENTMVIALLWYIAIPFLLLKKTLKFIYELFYSLGEK